MKKTVLNMLLNCAEKYPDTIYTSNKKDGEWVKYSSKDYFEISKYISLGLLSLGLEKPAKLYSVFDSSTSIKPFSCPFEIPIFVYWSFIFKRQSIWTKTERDTE